MASDGDFLWVAASEPASVYGGTHLLLLHKPSRRWVTQFKTDRTNCLAVDERYLWLGCGLSSNISGQCLQRIEKRSLYKTPEANWSPAVVGDPEITARFEAFDARDKALWHFTGGDDAKAAALLAQIEPPTPETLFLQGLCYDVSGLNELEKSRAFFQRIMSEHPGDPLADEARKQLGLPASQPAGASPTRSENP